MKFQMSKCIRSCFVVLGIAFLTACAVPKYSYDKEDAGTVFLSLTSNDAMSKQMVNWQITFEAIDEKARKELPGFGMTTSTRIYDWARKPEQQFKILELDKFGNVMQSTKIAPGRYKVRSINRQDKLIKDNLPYPFSVMLVNETNNDSIFPLIKTNVEKKFSNIEFTVEPGKAIYLGSFNAGMFECSTELGIFTSCKKFEIVVRDEFKRDTQLLKEYQMKRTQEPNLELVNRTLQIDAAKSPYFFTKQ